MSQQTIILASDSEFVAAARGDRMVLIHRGKTFDAYSLECIEGGQNAMRSDVYARAAAGVLPKAEVAMSHLREERKAFREKVEREAMEKAAKVNITAAAPATPPAPAAATKVSVVMDENAIERAIARASEQTAYATAKAVAEVMKPAVLHVAQGADIRKVEGLTHEVFEDVCQYVSADVPVFMTGAAGTGKNYVLKQVADALGLPFYFANAVQNAYQLTGFIDANGHYHETQFFKAFTTGGLFLLDEGDASVPEALIVLNAAIANGYFDFPTGRHDAHPNFRCAMAANTFGTGADAEYVGRFQLDAATLNRFVFVEVGYDARVEEACANGCADLLEFARQFRAACEKVGIQHVVSYRNIEYAAKMVGVLGHAKVIKACFTKHLGADDLRMIRGEMALNRRSPYAEGFLHI